MAWYAARWAGRTRVRNVLVFCIYHTTVAIAFYMYFSVYGNNVDNSQLSNKARTSMELTSNLDKRPYLVLGITSADAHIELREAQRSTWLSTIHLLQNELPFRIAYKFLIDRSTDKTTSENKKYKDILFLNVTHTGDAVKFGEKLYIWYKYIHEKYPDTLLAAKLDDDVFLCVPQLLKRLDDLKSKKLYYGWTHTGSKLNKSQPYIDEMFVLVGRDLLERILNRTYCIGKKCNARVDLIDHDYADLSLVTWLSIYDDVDKRPDNQRILHLGRGKEAATLRYIKPDFCSKFDINHKSSVEVMKKLHQYNSAASFTQNGFSDALTGSLFSGEVVRTLLPQSLPNRHKSLAILDKMPSCDKWAVVTTVFSPSKAVKNIAFLSDWCLVIVADTKTPLESTYLQEIGMNITVQKRIKYLSVKEQSIMYPLLSDSVPLNSFGRKNIGYIYAIHHKAKYIWDFDDDNDGIVDLNDFKTNVSLPHVTFCKGAQNTLLNPYPYFGVTENYTWPRGFPLQDIKNKTTLPELCKANASFQLGIVQSLANKQPDIDAIFRMTRTIPFNFLATRKSHRPLVLPRNVYAPFNAQATLWLAPAFPYLLLPISVSGRVTDIWRSYIALYFLHRNDIRFVFSAPYVVQDRNPHSYLRDFNAELDLYQKSKQLVDFLSSEKSGNIVDLYKSLYRREYLEQSDIQFAEAWQLTLESINKSG